MGLLHFAWEDDPELMEELRYHDKIILDNLEGIARVSGTDKHGSIWMETEFEPFFEDFVETEEVEGVWPTCDICEKEMYSGWICLDGGDEVCGDHILFRKDLPE